LVLGCGMLKKWKALRVLLIPILALVLWSLLNLWEYGGIHVLERPLEGEAWTRFPVRLPQLILCLGSVTPVFLLVRRGQVRRYAASASVILGVIVAL